MRRKISTEDCSTYAEFCGKSFIRSISIAFDSDAPEAFLKDNIPDVVRNGLTALANDPTHMFVSHNAPYDISCLHHFLGIPIPKNIFCTLEASRRLWPRLDHSLGELAEVLKFPSNMQKAEKKAGACGEDLAKYNNQDVEVLRHLFHVEMGIIKYSVFNRIISHMRRLDWSSLSTGQVRSDLRKERRMTNSYGFDERQFVENYRRRKESR